MKNYYNPSNMTILFGIITGLLFIPCTIILRNLFIPLPVILKLYIIITTIFYSLFLKKIGKTRLSELFLPLFSLVLIGFLVNNIANFMIAVVFIFAWIRSCICFPSMIVRRFIVEAVLGFVCMYMFFIFKPTSLNSIALSIWMFFLFQSIYFIVFSKSDFVEDEYINQFEISKKQVEDILSDC